MTAPDYSFENQYGRQHGVVIAGTDEAGRGPLAGPVVAAAVIIPLGQIGALETCLQDSKKLSEKTREALYPRIMEHCITAIASASVAEIDQLNILHASLLAMRRATDQLSLSPAILLVDGNKKPPPKKTNGKNETIIPIVKGDSKSLSIAAASILAKVTRDRIMQQLHLEYPEYGWNKNAGYPTALHRAALIEHGITPHHRRSFAPVRQALLAKVANEGLGVRG